MLLLSPTPASIRYITLRLQQTMIPYPAALKSRSKMPRSQALTQPDIQEATTESPTESRSPLPETLETVRSFTVSPKITARSQKALYTRTQAAIPYTTR